MNKPEYYIPYKSTKMGILRLSSDFCSLFPGQEVINGTAEIDEIGTLPIRMQLNERTIAGLEPFLKKLMDSSDNVNSIKIVIDKLDPLRLKVEPSDEFPQQINRDISQIQSRPENGCYLGEELDYEFFQFIRTGNQASLDIIDLKTHVFICGVTGAGKTVLGKILLEEASLAGIPCIAIDLKGDISSLALACSGYDDIEEYLPFLRIRDADSIEKVIASTSLRQRKNLLKYGLRKNNVVDFKRKVQVNIFTPRSNSGHRMAFSAFLRPPIEINKLKEEDPDAYESSIDFTCDNFIQRLNLSTNLKDKTKGYVYEIVKKLWEDEISVDGASGIKRVLDEIRTAHLGIEEIGGMPLEGYVDERDRKKISVAINSLLIGAAKLWFKGMPCDISLLTNKDEFNGLTPINIINLKHLSFREQAFVVGQIAYMINFWMREFGESDEPQLVFYIDEIGGGGGKEAFFPSVAKPPSKPALNLLLRQGRSFGVSCVFATQSPNDIDFKALANCRSWMVGQLRSNRERNNIKQGISNSDFRSEAYIECIADLSPGDFLVTAPSFPQGQKWKIFNERWLMSLHKGLSDREIQKIINKYEEDALYRYNLAEKKLKENKIKEAEDLLLSLIKGFRFSRNRSKGFLALAQLYFKVCRTEDAIELLSKLLQESIDMEDLTKAHFLVGKCHLRDKNYKESVAELELAMEFSADEIDNEQITRYLEYSKSQAEWEDLSTIKKLARWIFDNKTRKNGLLNEQLQDDHIEIIPFSSKMVYDDLTYYEQIDYELLTIEFEIAEQQLDAQEIVNQQQAHDYVTRRLPELSRLIYKNELVKAKELSERLVSRLVSSSARSPSEFLNLLKSFNEKIRDADEQKLRKIININARQFEYEVAALFSNKGFHTIVTNQTGDDGVDVFAFQNQERYLIQCKRYSKTKSIGRNIVDELVGTFTRYKGFTKAILITTSYFTDAAIKAAKTTDFQIELWDSYRFRKEWLKTMKTDNP